MHIIQSCVMNINICCLLIADTKPKHPITGCRFMRSVPCGLPRLFLLWGVRGTPLPSSCNAHPRHSGARSWGGLLAYTRLQIPRARKAAHFHFSLWDPLRVPAGRTCEPRPSGYREWSAHTVVQFSQRQQI